MTWCSAWVVSDLRVGVDQSGRLGRLGLGRSDTMSVGGTPLSISCFKSFYLRCDGLTIDPPRLRPRWCGGWGIGCESSIKI